MLAFFEFLSIVFISLFIVSLRLKPIIWAILFAIILSVSSLFACLHWSILVLGWFFYAVIVLTTFAIGPRRQWISHPIFNFIKKVLPSISETEQEALEAGDVWFESELFQGRPKWNSLLSVNSPTLTSKEQSFLDKQVNILCAMVDEWQVMSKDKDLPKQVWDYIKQEGFCALCLPEAYGGHDFSAFAHAMIIAKISTRSATAAVTVMVPNSLGPAELLLHYGTEDQKKYYLPRLAKGDEIPCFALTSNDAGSDAVAMLDKGFVCYADFEGKKVLGVRLSWAKRYITLAPIATLLALAFKLYDPEHLLGDKEALGITLALVPTNLEGVEIGLRHNPMGLSFLNGPTEGHNVFIPMSYIIGGQERVGQGWRMLISCLSAGRGVSLPALSFGTAQQYYKTTGAYARIRKQFNVPIGKFEGIAEKLAEISGFSYMIQACAMQSTIPVDMGLKPGLVSAISKYHLTELTRKIVINAMDIHGGKAIQLGPSNYIAGGYMSSPVSITVEGANVLTRNLMIFGQGVMRCHPYLRAEVESVNSKDKQKALQQFDTLLFGHIGFALSNFARTLLLGLTGGYAQWAPKRDKTAKYFKQLSRMSCVLAFVTDMTLLTVGGQLKRRESLSARLGDVLSHIFIGSAVLRYYHNNPKVSEHDCDHVKWSLQYCLYHIQHAFDEFFANFPIKIVGKLLRLIAFPYGVSYRHLPADKIGQRMVQCMLQPNDFRNSMIHNCYAPEDKEDIVAKLEDGFKKVIIAEPALSKLRKAIKDNVVFEYVDLHQQVSLAVEKDVITEEEKQLVYEALDLTYDVCAVDEFEFDLINRRKKTCRSKVKADQK